VVDRDGAVGDRCGFLQPFADRCTTVDSTPSQSTTPVLHSVPAIIVADHLLHLIPFPHIP
jgi:hypothetical protein